MRLTPTQVEELKEQLARHEQYSDCQRQGVCCSSELVEFLEELLAD